MPPLNRHLRRSHDMTCDVSGLSWSCYWSCAVLWHQWQLQLPLANPPSTQSNEMPPHHHTKKVLVYYWGTASIWHVGRTSSWPPRALHESKLMDCWWSVMSGPSLVYVQVGEEWYAWSICFRPCSALLTGIFLGSGIWCQVEGCCFRKHYFGCIRV